MHCAWLPGSQTVTQLWLFITPTYTRTWDMGWSFGVTQLILQKFSKSKKPALESSVNWRTEILVKPDLKNWGFSLFPVFISTRQWCCAGSARVLWGSPGTGTRWGTTLWCGIPYTGLRYMSVHPTTLVWGCTTACLKTLEKPMISKYLKNS